MSFLSKLFGIDSAKDAINRGAEANRQQAATTLQQQTDTQNPYYQPGVAANNQLANLTGLNGRDAQSAAYGNVQFSPDYQVRYDQGLDALSRANIAKFGSGASGNGNVDKALVKYGADQGTLGYNDFYNKLAGISAGGQQAGNQITAAQGGAGSAIQSANSAQAQGDANASLAGGNMLMGLLNTGANVIGYGMGPGFLRSPTASAPVVQNNQGWNYGSPTNPRYW